MTAAFLGPRGCLSAMGLAAVRSAPPGQAPPELARHLAECRRCQERMLAGDVAGPRLPASRGAGTAASRLWRAAWLVLAALALALGALVVSSLLRPR